MQNNTQKYYTTKDNFEICKIEKSGTFLNGKEIHGVKFQDIKHKMNFKNIERQVAFGETFDVLKDTNVFMRQAIGTIKEELPEVNGFVNETKRTIALRQVRDKAIEFGIEKELRIAQSISNNRLGVDDFTADLMDEFLNRTHPQSNWGDSSIIQLKIGDDIRSIQVGNPNDIVVSC
jgi:hypothetical protein